MNEHDALLDDAHQIRIRNPARAVIVPAVIVVSSAVSEFLDPMMKRASQQDGCVSYLLHRGKTYRVTFERL